jgi:hypothetical protein
MIELGGPSPEAIHQNSSLRTWSLLKSGETYSLREMFWIEFMNASEEVEL